MWNGTTGFTLFVQLHCLDTCEFMEQTRQDDTGTELNGSAQPGLTDEDA